MMSVSDRLEEELRSRSQTTIVSKNQQWYEETYIRQTSNPLEVHPDAMPMEPGKIYTFAYNPKYKDRLSFYDVHPINFIIGHIETSSGNIPNAYGINLSFVPPKIRATILDEIIRIFGTSIIQPNIEKINEGKIKTLSKLPIEYRLVCELLRRSGFKFAIRSYIYSRMVTKPRIIDYEQWWKLATFGSKYINKLGTLSIYWRYKEQLSKEDYRMFDSKKQKYSRKEKKIVLKNMTIKAVKEFLRG